MKKLFKLFIYGNFMLFFSCQSISNNTGDFKLLPLPQQFEISGPSGLSHKSVKTCFSPDDVKLPVLGEPLQKIKSVEKKDKAQIIYSINSSLDLRAEGYRLDISQKQITIVGKDEAGLFYGFKTLEQLLQESKDQKVFLPLCSIVDYPLLAYRSIHLDIKHHRQYFENLR